MQLKFNNLLLDQCNDIQQKKQQPSVDNSVSYSDTKVCFVPFSEVESWGSERFPAKAAGRSAI
jgi:hypothetical protein